MATTLAIALGLFMLFGIVALILLWAITEELPRSERVPYYERLDEGEWAVRLLRTGRRRMRTMRLINEVIGGDIATAKHLVEHLPEVLVEGISEALARELVADLEASGAEAEAFPLSRQTEQLPPM